jgi:hypothetical protein
LLPTEGEIAAAIAFKKQEMGMTAEQFEKYLSELDMTYESLQLEAKRDLAIEKLIGQTAGKRDFSDREIESYYNANRQKFMNKRGVQLAMILADPADNSAGGIVRDAKSEAEAQTKIESFISD